MSFDEFWQAYPRRCGKKAAKKAYEAALHDTDPETIYWGAKAYTQACEAMKTEPQHIKHPSTWLNNGCWDDEHPIRSTFSGNMYTISGERLREAKRELRVVK